MHLFRFKRKLRFKLKLSHKLRIQEDVSLALCHDEKVWRMDKMLRDEVEWDLSGVD